MIDAVPLLVLAFGEKVAVVLKYVFPLVPVNELMAEMAERLPPVTVTSPVVPFQVKSLGFSEKVNVMVAVWSALMVATSLVIVTVGGRVS